MNYRAEIDGLRAVAVVPVILYHASIPGITGGFVGVDVFFVKSGFLITTLILRAQDGGNFSLLTFYEKRARRILPALFLVLTATVVAGYNWIPFWEFPDFLRSVAATSLFLSNVHFWENVGYFALSAEEQPLLHTWSLGALEWRSSFIYYSLCSL
jgi:peptidoglycan/LPS O-acetylase OafA/YrhL